MDSTSGAPSRTAMMAACARAWHLFSEGPHSVFADWLAVPLVGAEAEALVGQVFPVFGDAIPEMAAWMAARSRAAEDWLAGSEAENYLLLGAGLDSYAWRIDEGLRVFEIDHPATQAWKRSRLDALRIPTPDHLTWVPVDFESEPLADVLAGVELGTSATFVSWLGVVPYLSLDAIGTTLDALPPCSLAVSYGTPEDSWAGECLRVSKQFQQIAAAAGEPLVSLLTPDEFSALLGRHGFTVLDDFGAEEVESRFGVSALANAGERIALAIKTG